MVLVVCLFGRSTFCYLADGVWNYVTQKRAALEKEGYRMLEVRSTTHNEREVTANVKWQRPDGSTVVRGGVGALLKEDH